MDKKLTLSLDQNIIEQAKTYARSNNVSLSKLIESYLTTLIKKNQEPSKITPLVESLSGVIDPPTQFNEKEAYSEYLIEKYK
ncbi:MAG: DUF6364 family protein [Tunicatimonas sp.]|uniref:DUF6364 family protein n=1 Tax=Tunicatimonas sp. TaxID=1940096 RepID=UPI003C737C30